MKEKTGAMIDGKSGLARNAVIFLAMAVVFRALGVVQRIGMITGYGLVVELLLPAIFCILLLVCVLFCGKRFLWISLLPMVVGLLFFILRALSTDNIFGVLPGQWEVLIRITVYLTVSVLYSAAVFKDHRLKWVLIPVIGLGILYHLVLEDYPALFHGETAVSFSGAMMELGILFLLVGLVFVALSLHPSVLPQKKVPEEITESASETDNGDNEEDVQTAQTESDVEPKPVFDASFFDQPYRPTLTLDPEKK